MKFIHFSSRINTKINLNYHNIVLHYKACLLVFITVKITISKKDPKISYYVIITLGTLRP